jgi:Gpi18-like mannosyltransferase
MQTKIRNIRLIDAGLFALIALAAVWLRVALLPAASGDITDFLTPWLERLRNAGRFARFGLAIGDYAPPYMYILSLISFFPADWSIPLIKLVSCVFDFAAAAVALRYVYRRSGRVGYGLAAFAAVLFLPTVWLNSAYWGQCDSIFTFFCLLSVLRFAEDKPKRGALFFGLAFIFKLQAVFLAPFLLYLWLHKKVKLRHGLIAAGVWVASFLPARLAGRSLGNMAAIYLNQTGLYPQLSLNAPNPWYFFGSSSPELAAAGLVLAAVAAVLGLYFLLNRDVAFTSGNFLHIGLFFAILMPFFLPHMHERYFYLADVLSLFYAFSRAGTPGTRLARLSRVLVPVCVGLGSMAAYMAFLFGKNYLTFSALMMTAGLGLVTYELFAPGPGRGITADAE